MKPTTIVNIYDSVARIPSGGTYLDAEPVLEEIHANNGLFLREEAILVYATNIVGVDRAVVKEQLDRWGCMYHRLQVPRRGHQTASTFNVLTPYGHRFGFDAETCVHVFGPGFVSGAGAASVSTPLGPRFHHYKECHLYVLQGRFLYAWLDAGTTDIFTETVEPGAIIHVQPGRIYTLEAMGPEGGSILQRSSQPEDEDNHSL